MSDLPTSPLAGPPLPAKTLIDLGWSELLGHLARRCHTERGAAAALELPFLDHLDDARRRLTQVDELRRLRDDGVALPFAGIEDVARLLTRVEKGGDLAGPELVAVAEAMAGCSRLQRQITSYREYLQSLAPMLARMTDLGEPVARPVLESFADDGQLADHSSERLRSLRRRSAQLHDQIIATARRLLDDSALAGDLQDRYYTQRNGRTVIPVRSDAPAKIRGIVHGSSHSGATLFVEPPALVELNNRLALTREEVAEEEARILAQLSARIREVAGPARASLDAATEIDVLDASARMAADLDARVPVVDGGIAFELRQARHPLMVLSGRTCVPNDLSVAPGTILVVSGPNAGGKTVALKTAGLAALMVRAGLPVAADDGTVPWFDIVHTDIGDDQSLERDLSTFSAHVLHLCEIIDDASPDALVLVDEVAAGTAPEQGAALAQAMLEHLVERGARGIITTHYEPIKAMAAADQRFASASVGFDLDALEPTFRLRLGAPGSSGALLVARRLGVPDPVLARAEALLGERRAGIDELLAAAHRDRQQAEDELEAAAQLRRDAASELGAARAAREQAERRLRELRDGAHGEAIEALRLTRAELDRLRTGLRRKRASDQLDSTRERVAQLARDVAEHAPVQAPLPGQVPATDQLVVGTKVSVARFGRGTVVDVPSDGRVAVQVGGMRTVVPIPDVRIDVSRASRAGLARPGRGPERGARRTPQRREDAPAVPDDRGGARTLDNTLDLRGERVEDGLGRLERFIDDSLLAEREIVFVIHGHGTGAMRRAVRECASAHRAVVRWRPGEVEEGGDGVTVVFLDAT
jgi:DNA mismatch repair protein MutS2